ncbi:DUF6477 family protein [Roseovarius aestuariivivens]|uniref:DUF6477 family protein n=1 Tax=Roseovarius aestuariivivens TaxID=1888910 RepID=UPI001FD9B9A8|nr:DUF6477 family protein [Roseovarius aestuariivivens]
MKDALAQLDTIKRPRLLINAARIGVMDYRRETHLPRHLGGQRCPRSREALLQLLVLEEEMNARRRARAAQATRRRATWAC